MNAVLAPKKLMSMEDQSEGKFMGRRFLLCAFAEIAGALKMFIPVAGSPPAGLGEFVTLTGVVLSAYYISGYKDRQLATEMQRNGDPE